MNKLLLMLAVVILMGCEVSTNKPAPTQVKVETPQRIKLVDEGNLLSSIVIYRVDDHEYIVNTNGGIIHSESCPCQKGKKLFN